MLNLLPVSLRSSTRPSILALPMLLLSMKAKSLGPCQHFPSLVAIFNLVNLPDSKEPWDNVAIELACDDFIKFFWYALLCLSSRDGFEMSYLGFL